MKNTIALDIQFFYKYCDSLINIKLNLQNDEINTKIKFRIIQDHLTNYVQCSILTWVILPHQLSSQIRLQARNRNAIDYRLDCSYCVPRTTTQYKTQTGFINYYERPISVTRLVSAGEKCI